MHGADIIIQFGLYSYLAVVALVLLPFVSFFICLLGGIVLHSIWHWEMQYWHLSDAVAIPLTFVVGLLSPIFFVGLFAFHLHSCVEKLRRTTR